MRLDELFSRKEQTLSFEFFPPKTERAWYTLEDTIDQLVPLGPDFVSVTYGAGGGTRAKTREVVQHIQSRTGVTAMAHLTCVNATKAELSGLLEEYAAAGIENILALRGDPPKGQARFTPVDGGCAYAVDLIDLVKATGKFAILCAAFPECHPDAPSRESDWAYLKEKFNHGAAAGITQCFFELAPYLELTAFLKKTLGGAPRVIPGILPVVDWGALQRFCVTCGAGVPPPLRKTMESVADDRVAARKAGMDYTIGFCQQLLEAGAPGIHIYALNRSTAAAEIVTALRRSGHLK